MFVELNYFYYLGGAEGFGEKKKIHLNHLSTVSKSFDSASESVFSSIVSNISHHLISNILPALFNLKLFLRGTKTNCAFSKMMQACGSTNGAASPGGGL